MKHLPALLLISSLVSFVNVEAAGADTQLAMKLPNGYPSTQSVTPKSRSYLLKRRTTSEAAKIIEGSFQRFSASRGLWKGYIKGSGEIHLHLSILRNGKIVSRRYMGSVMRDRWEKPTRFKYISSLPKGGSWSWRITAESV